MKKLTPLLAVEAIEPSLAFWVEALGFARTVEVPHDDALGFVILEKDGYEVMMQTIASIKADVPAAASEDAEVDPRGVGPELCGRGDPPALGRRRS